MLTLLLLGCEPRDDCGAEICNAEATIREDVPTVLTVTWTTSEPTVGHVEFGEAASLDLVTSDDPEPTTEHTHSLVGLPGGTEIFFKVVDESGESPVLTKANGGLPTYLPEFATEGEGNLGGYVVTVLEGSVWGPIILDADGRIVWWDVATDLYAVTRAYLSHDGKSVLYNESNDRSQDYADMEEAYVVRVMLDGSGETRIPLPYLSHDFVELPGGEIVGIARDQQAVGDTTYLGDKLTEVATDGSLVDRWSAFDAWDPAELGGVDAARGTWTHANAVDYEPDTDSFLVGLRNFASIVRVSRQTGEVSWTFGGLVGEQRPESGDGELDTYHQFELADGKLLAFDNGDPTRGYSRLVEYDVGDGTGAVTKTWEWTEDPPAYVAILGDANRLDGGDVVSSLSLSGKLVRVSPAGDLVFTAAVDIGFGLGYAQLVDSLY